MTDSRIYTTEFCGYCTRAKALLNAKGVAYREIDVTYDPDTRSEMMRLAGGVRTVPQIFIAAHHVGGWNELIALEQKGGLDPLLAEA